MNRVHSLHFIVSASLGCMLMLLLSCNSLKTRYEEIPPDIVTRTDSMSVGDSVWNWKLESLNGDIITFGALKNRIVFLNEWGSWCAPCVAEMPGLQQLYDSLHTEEGVTFAFISNERMSAVKEFVSKTKYSLPVYITLVDIPSDVFTGSFPTTYIMTGEGRILFRHVGSAKWNHPSVLSFLRSRAQESVNYTR